MWEDCCSKDRGATPLLWVKALQVTSTEGFRAKPAQSVQHPSLIPIWQAHSSCPLHPSA